MKRKGKIALGVICVLAVLIGLFAHKQWDNIMVLTSMGKYSTEELGTLLQENQSARDAAVADIQVRPLTDEEKQAIKSGQLSQEEAVARITGAATSSKPPVAADPGAPKVSEAPESTLPPVSKPNQEQESAKDFDGELAKLIGEIYYLESTFEGELEALLDSAIAEYRSLPSDKHTLVNQLDIGARYLGVAEALEKKCDQEMATRLTQIEGVLVAAGRDTALVGDIKSAYQEEKSLTKNYYLSLYS